MNIQVHLYKDSDCDLCKTIQQELMDNPPDADICIFHIKHEYSKTNAKDLNITTYPTIIVYDVDNNIEIIRFERFVTSNEIDKIIKDYETKCMV